MIPTLFGVLTAGLCLVLLLRASILAMFTTTMLLSLMGGSAAIVLVALGGSTVQPALLGLGFLLLKCILPGTGHAGRMGNAVHDLAYLFVFVLYGAVGAWLLPRIFAGQINVTPLRPIPDGYIYSTQPLSFTSQNITSSVYLTATLIAALVGHVACQVPGAAQRVARTAGLVAGTHALIGLSSVFLAGTPWTSVLKFFRNGFYAQLDQSFDGFVRMNGIWPEPAVFAAYGFAWLVFSTELWIRNVEVRWTGTGAAILALALLISTSTTAYIGLSAYGAVLMLRIVFIPHAVPATKAVLLIAFGLVGLAAIMALVALSPEMSAAFADFVSRFTVDKAQSASALQRAFWAKQGLTAFWASFGLGIGPGSFRSSSIVTAIIGSTGVIGVLAVVAHLVRVFKPLHKSSYGLSENAEQATGISAGWAAILMLVPATFSAASPDPGFVWGLFTGIALSLRSGTAPANGRQSVTRLVHGDLRFVK